MRTITKQILIAMFLLIGTTALAQEGYQERVAKLEKQKEQITLQEKDALKEEVKTITERMERGEISEEEAKSLKEKAAKKRALNIESRLAIIDNQIALLKRNDGQPLELSDSIGYVSRIHVGWGDPDYDQSRIFGIRYDQGKGKRKVVYDRRTYSDIVIAFGLNNAIIEGSSLNDSPYEIGGSRFFEIGWTWRTRVFKNSNFLRLHYGFSFQNNGLKSKNNQYFVVDDNGNVMQEEFEFDLRKSKFRMDNLVFPVYLEFGPSKRKEYADKIRFSIEDQFRIGLGGYWGFNTSARQKLKYGRNGQDVKDKLIGGYNTSNFVYGLSAYAGVGGTLLYIKYDLNPIFDDAPIEQRNISLGLRFDL
ncbi:MAG: hypothetical protein KJO90_01075 [Eudoraea sp.]|nr:hypothetical protein [Eudoraea sp.]